VFIRVHPWFHLPVRGRPLATTQFSRARSELSFALATLLFVLAGCPAARAPLPGVAAADPADILAIVRAREERITSLRARFTARTRTPGGERSADGVLLVKKPDSFRLRLYLPFGLTVFDYVSVGERVQLSLPLEGRIVNGPPTGDLALFSQSDLGQAFLRGPQAFPGTCRPQWDGDGAVLVRCSDAAGVPQRRLRIDARTATIAEEISYAEGSERVVMRFEDYRVVDGGVLPFRIALSQPQRGVSVTISVRRHEVNPELKAELFAPALPWPEAGS
jgi:hypothetical protein